MKTTIKINMIFTYHHTAGKPSLTCLRRGWPNQHKTCIFEYQCSIGFHEAKLKTVTLQALNMLIRWVENTAVKKRNVLGQFIQAFAEAITEYRPNTYPDDLQGYQPTAWEREASCVKVMGGMNPLQKECSTLRYSRIKELNSTPTATQDKLLLRNDSITYFKMYWRNLTAHFYLL